MFHAPDDSIFNKTADNCAFPNSFFRHKSKNSQFYKWRPMLDENYSENFTVRRQWFQWFLCSRSTTMIFFTTMASTQFRLIRLIFRIQCFAQQRRQKFLQFRTAIFDWWLFHFWVQSTFDSVFNSPQCSWLFDARRYFRCFDDDAIVDNDCEIPYDDWQCNWLPTILNFPFPSPKLFASRCLTSMRS